MIDSPKLFLTSEEESKTFWQKNPEGKYKFTIGKSGLCYINNRPPKYFKRGDEIEISFNQNLLHEPLVRTVRKEFHSETLWQQFVLWLRQKLCDHWWGVNLDGPENERFMFRCECCGKME